MAERRFGTPLNPAVKQKPTAYKKTPRGEEPMNPKTGWDGSDQYADTYCRDEHNSEFERKYWSPNPKKGSALEIFDGNGNGKWRGPDSCEYRVCNGTDNFHGKNGGIRTLNSNEDAAIYGGSRDIVGTDTKAGGKHLGRAPGGARYTESFGYDAHYAAMKTEGYSAASGVTRNTLGKYVMNAEGGVGIGVNKGSSMKVFTRWEPDGTFHLQVTPKGQEGGNAVVKINPDGTILVTTVKTITMKAAQSMTIETPTLNIKANIKHTGNMKTSGIHVAKDGPHKACG